MFTARKKIAKAATEPVTQLEEDVAKAIFDVETNSAELRSELRDLAISAANEVDVAGGKKAIVVFVPYTQLKPFHRIQTRLVRELEKKFSGKHVIIIAQRRILRKPSRNNQIKRQKRPYSRTTTAVHNALLDDLVYPSEIVGKRLRYSQLDRKDQQATEYKLDTFSSVYKKLTGHQIAFEYPVAQQHD